MNSRILLQKLLSFLRRDHFAGIKTKPFVPLLGAGFVNPTLEVISSTVVVELLFQLSLDILLGRTSSHESMQGGALLFLLLILSGKHRSWR